MIESSRGNWDPDTVDKQTPPKASPRKAAGTTPSCLCDAPPAVRATGMDKSGFNARTRVFLAVVVKVLRFRFRAGVQGSLMALLRDGRPCTPLDGNSCGIGVIVSGGGGSKTAADVVVSLRGAALRLLLFFAAAEDPGAFNSEDVAEEDGTGAEGETGGSFVASFLDAVVSTMTVLVESAGGADGVAWSSDTGSCIVSEQSGSVAPFRIEAWYDASNSAIFCKESWRVARRLG